MSELSAQTLAAPQPRVRSLPHSPEARQVSVAAAAPAAPVAPVIGANIWRGVAFALAIEGIVLWAVLAADGWQAWTTSIYGLMLLGLAAIDIDRFRLPNALTYPLLVMGLGTAWLIHPGALPDHVIGAAAGFLSFAAFREVYFRLRGREGLGLGDAKLMAAVGAWCSWQGLPSVVLIGAFAALSVTLVGRMAGQRVTLDHRLPFGAYLAVGAWLVWLYGPITIL